VALPVEFWRGARAALFIATVLVSSLTATFLGTGIGWPIEALAGAVAGAMVFGVAALATSLIVPRIRLGPPGFYVFAVAALVTFIVLRETRFRWTEGLFYPAALAFLFAQAVLGGVLWTLVKVKPAHGPGATLGWWLGGLLLAALAIDVGGLAYLANDGRDPYPFAPVSSENAPPGLDVPNPGESGNHQVEALTYGSGTDRRRPEFGAEVDVQTRVVDASKLLPDWKDFKARAREWYWGFSLEQAPLNARVWMPAGEGPFPLVLVVHGNHRMEDHSDLGYAYLGELLASRGFILASIDENFINGTWSGDFGGKEMPLRGWLLLEHLKLWREWNGTPTHPLHGKADLSRIALMGHSRGGEAAAIAAGFNELPFYPDDASVAFDFGFDIQAVVAIAQIDRRYPRRMELENVNFLALQGSYDSDEVSFHGLRQLRRIRFGTDGYWFKAGVYVHGANHGQFNTDWGRRDAGPPSAWLLNVAPIIDGEDQRTVAKVYISAFLEAVLHDDLRFLPLFQDPRVGSAWLPDVALAHQFEDSTFRPLADFEEDIDVTTATIDGATIEAADMTLWREEELMFRDDSTQGTNVVVLGWQGSGEPSYSIRFASSAVSLNENARLTFFLSPSMERPPAAEKNGANASNDATRSESDTDEKSREESGAPTVPDVSIEVTDEEGERASLALREVAPMAPFFRTQFLKPRWLNRGGYAKPWEPTLRSFEIALTAFAERNPELDLGKIARVAFRLSGEPGVLILDDVGFRSDPETAAEREPSARAQREAKPSREARSRGGGALRH
jgi:predicted dienelactone hydrolase